jgi:hypothetical protein
MFRAKLTSGLRLIAVAAGLCAATALAADQPSGTKPIEQGQHVLIVGNSFQVFCDSYLKYMAEAAGIKDHVRGGDPLAVAKVDVAAINPWFRDHDKPDKSLEDLTERGLKHNPNIRILAQASWLPYDDPIFPMSEKDREKTNWSARPIADVRSIHTPYLKNATDQVQAINKRHGKQVVFLVPTAQAVIVLREKVIAGQAAGLKSSDELFSDSIGHARPPVELLNAYCHFAVVYRRTPVGLALKGSKDEKMHRLLQEIAWDAVCKEPLSGVKTMP